MRLARTFACPVELTMEILGGKWKTVLLAHLKGGPLRYGELRRRTPALSDKMLTARLHDLEELGLVTRDAGRRGAPVSYALTARGRSLGPLLQALYDWGQEVAGEVGARLLPR
ncbi:MAG: helix-turn-helix domain-containing protein [Minicystis sp.]